VSEATPKTPIFQHGLLKPERGHMTTLFTLIIFWLVGTIVGAVLLPYEAQRFTDGWWTDNDHILFLTSLCFVSTLHGALAYMLGYQRGGKVSNFFLGALLLTLGLVIVLVLNGRRPEAPPPPSRGLMKKADRLAYLTGNLWFGIAQLTVMMVFLMVATVYETKVGGTEGNRAAYAAYYNHWSFGLIFVLFFVTIFCTTMRKWPFRVSQIGWLATHLGLLVTMAGCMVMFWGTYDGFAKLLEGDTITHVSSRSERELRIAIPALRFDQKFLVEVDRDPEESDVEQVIEFPVTSPSGETRHFTARIDRFYSKADEFEEVRQNPRLAATEDAPAKAGFNFEISIPEQGSRKLFALEDAPQLSRGMPLQPRVIRVTHQSILDAFAYRYPAGEKRRGRLIVEDKSGREIASLVITPGARDADPRLGAAVDASIPLPNGATLSVDRYFSYLVGDEQGLRDESPNQPALPGIRFRVTDAQGVENHSARIDGHWFNSDTQRAEDSRHPYVFRYLAKASNPRPSGSLTYVVGPKPGDRHLVLAGMRNDARILPYEKDRVYRLAPNAPVTVKALDAFDDAVHVSGVRKGERNAPYGIRVAIESGSQVAKTWVFDYQRDILTEDVQLGDLLVNLGYGPRQTRLGFTLSLIDFRHENYPNSNKAKRFEANVIVNDREAGGVSTALIDMNHPLQHRDFRFFNQNPIGNDKGRRGVIFSVGNNPGMPTLLVGFTITTIGLILVFFFKPSLRRWETRRREERAAIPA
jgi:ResB-like family